jgi:hypothetical protein
MDFPGLCMGVVTMGDCGDIMALGGGWDPMRWPAGGGAIWRMELGGGAEYAGGMLGGMLWDDPGSSGGIAESLPIWGAAYFLERAYCLMASLIR